MKDTYDDIFGKTGTCINLVQLQDPETLEYVKKHFSSFTLENEMKPDYLMPGWLQPISTEEAKKKTGDYVIPESYKETTVPQFNYDTVDKVLKIAKDNGLKIRYHVLVWHSQSPEWFFKENYSQDKAAEYVSEEVMYERMRMYISSMIHHVYTLDNGAYKDVVYTWDVANEYFSNTPDKNWAAVFGNRENIQGETSTDRPALGTKPTYIKRAFEMAYDALTEFGLQDKVPLFYNDFNTYFTTEKIIEMINFINEDREVCSGVGMQSHLALANPTVDTYINTVAAFVQEGFQVQIKPSTFSRNRRNSLADTGRDLAAAYPHLPLPHFFHQQVRKLFVLRYDQAGFLPILLRLKLHGYRRLEIIMLLPSYQHRSPARLFCPDCPGFQPQISWPFRQRIKGRKDGTAHTPRHIQLWRFKIIHTALIGRAVNRQIGTAFR